jgi:YlmC/YmxH family sporulation protein
LENGAFFVMISLCVAYIIPKGERGMIARITDMHNKEVINICDGTRLGYVDDLEVDTCTAQITALVICGRSRLFGILGRDPDVVIQWKDIEVVGDETILVNFQCATCDLHSQSRGKHILGGLFR